MKRLVKTERIKTRRRKTDPWKFSRVLRIDDGHYYLEDDKGRPWRLPLEMANFMQQEGDLEIVK